MHRMAFCWRPVNVWGLSQEEEVSQEYLDKEDGGDAEGELSFLRFVPEEGHP